ncbi:VPLPA-CTERM sorting domain-containing protein [Roseobacter sinensis]|uniref:VPLPA-CTERM sorting domain-containing protein n=1 Tax=Roseobacter sinensis TaxID=2931391 RepID=A0ABT3BCD7_9RHOB|nr:VPLPA-CTERM sorting domain-containing protein [Roseobacter sp. WL0113]MCV3271074.1 VPLPA-CTERM sorting domain-containing protein [Roseobacter sp. WL0113]
MKTFLLAASLACLSAPAFAASAVFEGFDTGAGAWEPNTSETNTTWFDTGGNPGGALTTNNFGAGISFGIAGAKAEGGAYSGELPDGDWTVSVDLLYFNTPITEAQLRWRYRDATFNGWYIPIEQTTFELAWTSYSVTFDTTWSDATAQANGWVQESASVPFATLWDDIYWSEIRLIGPSIPGSSAFIDNYSVQPTAVPLPAGLALMGSALLGLGGVARRRAAKWR